MMLFKTWGYITMANALNFVSDMKLAHYMKLPPRATFAAQVSAAMLAGTTQLGVQAWMFGHVRDICDQQATSGFVCPSTEVFGVASVLFVPFCDSPA